MTTPLVSATQAVVTRGHTALGPWTFQLHAGQLVTITGSNGSGKSTLLALISGALSPTTGEVTRAVSTIGLAPEPFRAPHGMRVGELLAVVASTALAPVPTAPLRVNRWHDRPVRDLSRGERKRVVVAQALLGSPPLVLLDEPLEGLDAPSCEHVIEAVSTYVSCGGCAVVATHRPERWTAHHTLSLGGTP